MEVRDHVPWICALISVLGLALAIVGSGIAGTTASTVSPGVVLDQNNPSRASACRYTGWTPDDANGWAAQTFTAGVSGRLTDVVVWVRISSPQIGVAIVPVDAAGRPVIATPLASTTLAAAPSTTYVDVEIHFATPARLEAGKQYAIVLSSSTGGAGAWVWKADLGFSTIDPNGTRCADGVYGGGRLWVSSAPIGSDADFFFQTFVLPARHVTVTKVGSGTGLVQDSTHVLDCGPSCSGEFFQGETVTLTATPAAGSIFTGWSGGCAGTRPTCSLPVSGDVSVTAAFTGLVTLTVHRLGRGTITSLPSGIACGRTCSHRFVPGRVKLIARPFKGWHFARWRGGCRGRQAVCRFRLARPGSVSALFVRTAR